MYRHLKYIIIHCTFQTIETGHWDSLKGDCYYLIEVNTKHKVGQYIVIIKGQEFWDFCLRLLSTFRGVSRASDVVRPV